MVKPCPFCRSTNIKYSVKGKRYYYQAAYYCRDCNCYGPRILSEHVAETSYPQKCAILREGSLQQQAEEAWNSRG